MIKVHLLLEAKRRQRRRIRELAAKTGLSKSTVHRALYGRTPNLPTLEKVARALGVRLRDLVA